MILGEEATNYILNFAVWDLTKVGLLGFLGLYVIFALLVIRQVQLLTSVLGTNFSPLFKTAALLHVILAAGVFAFAFAIL